MPLHQSLCGRALNSAIVGTSLQNLRPYSLEIVTVIVESTRSRTRSFSLNATGALWRIGWFMCRAGRC